MYVHINNVTYTKLITVGYNAIYCQGTSVRLDTKKQYKLYTRHTRKRSRDGYLNIS